MGGYGIQVELPTQAGEKGTGAGFIERSHEEMNPVMAPLTLPSMPPFTSTSKVGHPGCVPREAPEDAEEPEPDPDAALQEPPKKEPPPDLPRKPRPHPKPKHKARVAHVPKPKPPKVLVLGSLSLRGDLVMDPPSPKPKPHPKPKPKPKAKPKPQPRKKEPPKPKVEPKQPEEEDPDEPLEYRERARLPELEGDGSGLLGSYYEGRNFERPLFRRADHNIEFDWRSRLPDARMPRAAYSVRWIGKVVPRYSEEYTFFIASDDGARLWVNGQKLIDCWQIQGLSENKGRIRLDAGKSYDLRVEFFEKVGDTTALVYFYWESPSQKREFVPEGQLRFPEQSTIR